MIIDFQEKTTLTSLIIIIINRRYPSLTGQYAISLDNKAYRCTELAICFIDSGRDHRQYRLHQTMEVWTGGVK